MPLHSTHFFKRSFAALVLISLLSTILPINPIVEAVDFSEVRPGGGLAEIRNVGSVDTIYGLVAILVDEDTWNAQTSGESEFATFENKAISDKIKNYAENVQSALPWTKSMIITVGEEDGTMEIHKMLERLYFEGNPNDEDITQLSGVVIVGDKVPLPVVNKNGYTFLSMLPYTDFEDPAYVPDEYSLDFIPNTESQNVQSEVWQGLIIPPLRGQAGYDLLGKFFEKNNSYYNGDEEYTSFDKKVFMGDFIGESSAVNSISFASYERFLKIWEEIAFYQYSSRLLESLILDMNSSVEAGDGLDNDQDGLYDEEALNGVDDDGDGLIDEDIGDGFYQIDNDQDGLIDEDGISDNNNDSDWVMNLGSGEWFEDKKIDEDPPGDVTGGEDLDGDGLPDGDGCPGLCGVDDSGYATDHDGDGYPTGIEIVFGYDWQDTKRPWQTIGNKLEKLMNDNYGANLSFAKDEEAIAWAEDQFTDGFFKDYYLHPSCYDEEGNPHPEWDDDEDGFCDEDGSTTVKLWADEYATPYQGSCVYNDGDCDGLIDEDPEGFKTESQFENLPDIQSKALIEALTARYTDIFQKPIAKWNKLIGQSGRWDTQVLDENANTVNDYDSAVSLIAKKDEYTLQYLDQVNRELEDKLNNLVEDELQVEIPLVAAMEIYVEYFDEDEEKWNAGCKDMSNSTPDLDDDACVQFVNHTISKDWQSKSFKEITNGSGDTKDIFINGQELWTIDRVYQCGNAGGTYSEDGGQIVDFNLLYSYEDTTDIQSKEDYRAIANCVPDMASVKEDLPYVCDSALVEEPIRSNTGAVMPSLTEDEDGDGRIEIYEKEEQWERGFGACFEFRELSTYYDYKEANGGFNDWIAAKIRKLRKQGEADDEESYADFLDAAQNKIEELGVGTKTLKKKYHELDMFQKEDGIRYTVYDMFKDLGMENYSEDQMDLYLGLNEYVEIDNPSYGSGMENVGKIKVYIKKAYFEKDSTNERGTKGKFTYENSDAYSISSVYKHTQPWKSVLNDQIEAASVPNLPIDKIRRISFYDGNEDRNEVSLNYINLFNAKNMEDVNAMFQDLSESVGTVRNGNAYAKDVLEWQKDINAYQLEDALKWMNMNIDEKHAYVLNSYVGLDEPIIGKSRQGYELVSIIANGTATELYAAFNGDVPEMEGDLEWQYRSQDAIDAALAASESLAEADYEDIGGLEDYRPVVLTEWMQAISDWFEELSLSIDREVELSEEIENKDVNGMEKEIGELSALVLSGESSILPAGGESTGAMRVELQDAFGNLVNNAFYTVTLEADSGMEILDLYDENTAMQGMQVTTSDGFIEFRVLSSDTSGTAKISASMPGIIENGDIFTIDNVEDLYLKLKLSEKFMFAGSESVQSIDVKVVDDLRRIIKNFNGEIYLSIGDPAFGSFEEDSLTLINGEGKALFKVGDRAGNVQIIADGPGLTGGSTNLEVKPARPYELRIRSANGATQLNAGESSTFIIESFDKYGNKVTTDSSTSGEIRLTKSTEKFGSLSKKRFKLNQGSASFNVQTNSLSGIINIIASSGDLLAGTWGGKINYSISGKDFANMEPQMLYASVLGGPFGDVTQENYIGGWLTFNGKTQAISTLLSDPSPKERLAGVDANGNIMLSSSSLITLNALDASSDLPMRFQLREYPSDALLAEVIYAFPSNTKVKAELLSLNSNIELDESNGEYLLRDNGVVVLKVLENGQLVIKDPNYRMAVSENSQGIGIVVSKASNQVLLIEYETNWEKDVQYLDSTANLSNWKSWGSGIYLKASDGLENSIITIPTGNSSLSPKGLAIINPDQEVPSEQKPVETNETGWEKDNKTLLLYAAGSSVGESNMYYNSEIGTVLGDPTIKLTTSGEVNELGFSDDIGRMVYANENTLLDMIALDFNNDDQEDVLLAYEDGRVELLQNVKSPGRLINRGTLLQIETGIRSVDSGDYNGDGLDDLFVVTKESCFADEMCLYVFENIGGGFVAKNLTLDEIPVQPVQVKAADLNQDGSTDLILVDENMVLYVAWNVKGEIRAVDTIRDFGLTSSNNENLYSDLVLRYNNMEEGDTLLPIRSSENISPDMDTEIQTLLDSLSLNEAIDLEIDGISSEGEIITQSKNLSFKYANNENVKQDFYIRKNITDKNGGKVRNEDMMEVSIFIKNQSGENVEDLYLSDQVSGIYDYQNDNLNCINCNDGNGNPEISKGSGSRPWIFGPLNVAAGESIQLSYLMKVKNLPKVEVLIGQDLQSDYRDDDYPDIGVSLEGNTTGQLMVYYSDGFITESKEDDSFNFLGFGANSYKRIIYTEKEYSPESYAEEYQEENYTQDTILEDLNKNGIPDIVESINSDRGLPVAPSGTYDPAAEILGAEDLNGDGFYTLDEFYSSKADIDEDGWNDTIDNWVQDGKLLLDPELALEAWKESGVEAGEDIESALTKFDENSKSISTSIENIVSTFNCNESCIAMPGSVAFLAPGYFHDPLTGTPLMFDPGTPVFGITGIAPPAGPPVCFGKSCYVSFTMRTYLAPTTTLGLGLGLCLGAYPTGKCYSFALPITQALGITDAINRFIAESLSGATEFEDGINQAFSIDASSQIQMESDPSTLSSDIFTNYEPLVASQKNIQVPGFPSVFTEWWKKQKLEFYKMLDLPDITFKYPSGSSLKSQFTLSSENGKKVEELTSGGIFNLEQWLNYAQSLPLIDIKPEPVTIYYPQVSEEERLAFVLEATDWSQDAIEELERFLGLFCLELKGEAGKRELIAKENCVGEKLDPAKEQVLREIVAAVDDTIGAVNANISAVESYAEIPQQILEIRSLQSYYAKSIISYLDLILSRTAAYMSDNIQRIEAWAQWVVDMKSIIDGWKLLIDLSLDFMQATDQGTNQRYSALQLIFNLFVFVPEFPVIEFPKLPDIVIDVSQIQAGLDVKWPDVKFKPSPISLPSLPRLILPSTDLDLDFNINVEIPVLPTFDMNFELPDLPALTLPTLPSLPPPPAIPEILPDVQAALNISSNILRIISLIRSGFIPIDEMLLKGKIEDLTERPGGLLLASDLRLSYEWPGFRKDFLERIEINTYLNLTMDFTPIYDYVKDIGTQSQSFINSSVDDVKNAIIEAVEGIENSVNLGAKTQSDLSASLNYSNINNPALETALAYKDDPLVRNNLLSLKSGIEKIQESISEWAKTLPEKNVELIAGQEFLAKDDPLLQKYDEIITNRRDLDAKFLATIQNTPLAGLAFMRESLIAYVENIDKGTQILKGLDDEAFNRYLAQENSLQPRFLLASEDSKELQSSELWYPETLVKEDEMDIKLASLDETGGLEALEYGSEAYAYNEGIFIYNEESGVNEKLVAYSQESNKKVNILFMDLDNDGDEDVLYSLGGDIYFKENYSKNPRLRYVKKDPISYSVKDLMPAYGAVKNFKTGKNSYKSASFAMNDSLEASAYDVLLYDSMDAMIGSPEENIERRLLLENEENNTIELYDENGKSNSAGNTLYSEEGKVVLRNEEEDIEMEVEGRGIFIPEIRKSRVIVDNVLGRAKLNDAYARLLIGANGEIETSKDVVLQTLTNVRIEIETESGIMNVELPENIIINLGRDPSRVLRIDSGRVIWIDFNTKDPDQEIIEGMEIFPNEGIKVQGWISKVKLKTSEGVNLTLNNDENFVLEKLLNPDNPSATIDVSDGAYYTRTRGIYPDGSIGTLSDNILLNPQICADASPPYPIINAGNGSVDVAIFKTKEISAENSFDSDSEIVSAFWDFDASKDSDGDGDSENDVDASGLVTEIGPYDNTDTKKVILTITDVAGNQASTYVNVNVYVPDLILEEAKTSQVSGISDPATDELPYYLVREREGAVNEIGNGPYFTDEAGNLLVNDLKDNELLNVFDKNGLVIAQLNPNTRQVVILEDGYDVEALAAGNGWPSHLSVYDTSNGTVLGSFIFVSDSQRSIVISPNKLERLNLGLQESLTAYFYVDRNQYEVTDKMITARNANGSLDMQITSDGNINIYNSERYKIVKRYADSLDDYMIIELYDYGVLEMEIWVGGPETTTIQSTAEMGLSESKLLGESGDLSEDTRIYFEDISVDDPLYPDILELVERGVIEGSEIDGKRYFLPDNNINRAEFSKIVLSILCIVPREEAYLEPNVFNDILDVSSWYYPFTKEAFLNDLITGYLGELDENGQAPFKPENTINRAEAVKIIIEALINEGVIEDINPEGEPWYAPYMEVAQDLGPYLLGDNSAGDALFIVTPEEAANPNQVLTRYDFVEMSVRVLKANNCFDLDSDGDGLINYDEESLYGTDPYNPDSDAGGVDDGSEVARGTDPKDSNDDFDDAYEYMLEAGIYAIRENCNACPCLGNIDWDADLRAGDSVFAIIRNEEGTIFESSNTLIIDD